MQLNKRELSTYFFMKELGHNTYIVTIYTNIDRPIRFLRMLKFLYIKIIYNCLLALVLCTQRDMLCIILNLYSRTIKAMREVI